MEVVASWVMLVAGVAGFVICFPLWLTNRLNDRAMLGITLTLSWAALWYSALTTLFVAK